MRRMVVVLDYFDEERDIPWNYVARTRNGLFEAVASYLLDGMGEHEGQSCNKVNEHKVGTFLTVDAATEALRDHLRRADEFEYQWRAADGSLNFNWTQH